MLEEGGRRRRRRNGGYSPKNKKPTRQCGEKQEQKKLKSIRSAHEVVTKCINFGPFLTLLLFLPYLSLCRLPAFHRNQADIKRFMHMRQALKN